jgi:N-ATPase, AtpR subunit
MNFQALRLLAFLAFGAGFGAAYLSALSWNARLYCAGFVPLALSVHLVRFVGTVALFLALARTGAAPLLSSFAGFQLSRILSCGGGFLISEAASSEGPS